MQTQRSVSPALESLELFLRIQHPSRDPDEFTETLEVEPEHCIKAGVGQERDGVRRLHAQSYWLAALPLPPIADVQEGYAPVAMHEQFPSLSKKDLPLLRGATECDVFILMWLKRFETHRDFFRAIAKDGGSVTFLIERDDANSPVGLKTSLGKLAEFGIGVELN